MRKRVEKPEWLSVAEEFEASGQTQRESAEGRGLRLSTLQSWVYRRRRQERPGVEPPVRLLPVQVSHPLRAEEVTVEVYKAPGDGLLPAAAGGRRSAVGATGRNATGDAAGRHRRGRGEAPARMDAPGACRYLSTSPREGPIAPVAAELRGEQTSAESKAARDEAAKKKRRERAARKAEECPTREIRHAVPQEERHCPACGSEELKALGKGRTTEVYEYVPARFERQVHVQEVLACACGQGVVTAPAPAKVVDRANMAPPSSPT